MTTIINSIANFLSAALRYAERGLSVFPLKPADKKPATAHGFKDATTNPEQIRRWWTENPSYNIGIATGDVSGIIVIDVDGTEGEKSLTELEAKLGKLPETVTVITPGKIKNGQHTGTGRHLIFKAGNHGLTCRTGVVENVDVRANGGYIVAAQSVHPDGTGTYTFAVERSFNEIDPAELPSDWIEFLRAREYSQKGALVVVNNLPVVVDNLPPATETIIEQCRQEVAWQKPAIEGQGGDKQTFTVSCLIFYHWGLSASEGRPIFDEYNARCLPPWGEKQLLSKIGSAINVSCEKPRGWKRSEYQIEGEYCPMFGAFLLNPKRTLPSAFAFRRERYNHEEGFLLRYYGGDFYRWTGNYYEQVHKDAIKQEALGWLTKAVILNKKGEPENFPANNRTVEDMIEALKSVCLLENVTSGTWIGRDEIPLTSPPIFTQNCVYDWRTGTKYPLSPHWFNLSCLNTVIDDDVPAPEGWLRFLNELWENDEASKDLLHEFMGLSLTMDTSFQKILLILGPPRAGKGVIIRTISAIHGQENVAAPSTGSLTQDFGLQPLIGKPLAVISDARFAGRDIQVAIERLLNISGEDAVMVNKKHLAAISVKLPTRLIIVSNEMPRLPDNAGALANRFIPLRLKNSFLGREDSSLGESLLQELPGILKLMIEGLRRLDQHGFTKTSYQVEFIRDVEELGSPIRAFVRERCELGADKWVNSDVLWNAWLDWSEGSGHEGGGRPIFGRNLKASFPGICKKKKSGMNCYYGIGLIEDILEQWN